MTDGCDVTPGNQVTIALVSDADVRSWSIACITTDETSSASAINASLVIDSITKTAKFTAPASGKALRFMSTVNSGYDRNGIRQPSYSTTFCIYTPAAFARVHALDETTEGNRLAGWGASVNTLIRGGASITSFTHEDGSPQQVGDTIVLTASGWRTTPLNTMPPSPPALVMLSLAQADTAGGQTVTAYGINLTGTISVRVGMVDVMPISSGATTCTFITPPHDAGDVAVSVRTPTGTSNSVTIQYVESNPNVPPSIISLSPTLGDLYGNAPLSLAVKGEVTSVTLGGFACTSVVQTGDIVTCTSPVLPAGQYDVVVSGPYGSSNPIVRGFEAWHPTIDLPSARVFQSDRGLIVNGSNQVQEWNDLGNLGRKLVASAFPTLDASAFGSVPGIVFPGTAAMSLAGGADNVYQSAVEKWVIGKTVDTRSESSQPMNPPSTLIGSLDMMIQSQFGLANGALSYHEPIEGDWTTIERGGGLNDGQSRLFGVERINGSAKLFVGAAQQGTTYMNASLYVSSSLGWDTVGAGSNLADRAQFTFGAILVVYGDAPTSSTFRAKLNAWARKWGSIS